MAICSVAMVLGLTSCLAGGPPQDQDSASGAPESVSGEQVAPEGFVGIGPSIKTDAFAGPGLAAKQLPAGRSYLDPTSPSASTVWPSPTD